MGYSIKETGMRIHMMRNTLNLSAKEFSDALGISTQHLSRIEHGIRGASIDVLFEMHEKFGIDLNYLITGKSDRKEIYDFAIVDIIHQLSGLLSREDINDEGEEQNN